MKNVSESQSANLDYDKNRAGGTKELFDIRYFLMIRTFSGQDLKFKKRNCGQKSKSTDENGSETIEIRIPNYKL